MWLISFMMFTFAPGVSCWVGGVVMYSLARRLRSVALLRNVMTSLSTVFDQERRLLLLSDGADRVGFWWERETWRCGVLPLRGLVWCLCAQLFFFLSLSFLCALMLSLWGV